MNQTGGPRISRAENPTILGAYARLLFDYLRALGCDPTSVLPAAQVAEIEVAEAHALTSRDEWLDMIARIAGQTDDQDLALKIGEAFQIRHLGLAGHVLINCTTLGEAGRQVVRYYHLMGDMGGSQLRRRGEWAEDIFEWAEEGPPPPALEQLWAAATVSLGRWLTGRNDLRWEAHFRFPRPANISHYERIFQGTPRFGQATTKLVFPAEVLDLPIAMGNPELRVMAETQANAVLKALETEPEILRRTRLLIAQHLAAGRASLDDVAPMLGVSGRTLHRRLAECGCSFRELADTVRRSRAEGFLRNPAVSLAEIAFMLGYSEQSTFQHAFKRWTGQTPGEFRARMSDKPDAPRRQRDTT
jgi:AraC-like DNA-binding protein